MQDREPDVTFDMTALRNEVSLHAVQSLSEAVGIPTKDTNNLTRMLRVFTLHGISVPKAITIIMDLAKVLENSGGGSANGM